MKLLLLPTGRMSAPSASPPKSYPIEGVAAMSRTSQTPPQTPLPSPTGNGTSSTPTVLEKWELGEVIGSGSYSNVYRATDADGGVFAVKVIFDNPKKPYLRDRARREAESMRVLAGHKNIIGLEEFIEQSDRVCIVMPFVPAGTLLTYINSFLDPLPEAEVACLLLQLIDALQYAHSHGWVLN